MWKARCLKQTFRCEAPSELKPVSHQPHVFFQMPAPSRGGGGGLSHQLTCRALGTPISSLSSQRLEKNKTKTQQKKSKNNKRTGHSCWLRQCRGSRMISSDFMQQVTAGVVVLSGESVAVPFCSTSCHWECEQQRAAWMHKYKLEGLIRQSSRARAGLHLRVSQHAARLLSDSCSGRRAGHCDQHKLHHRATRGTRCRVGE